MAPGTLPGVHSWTPDQVAQAAGARLIASSSAGDRGPDRAVIDSRQVGPGALFVGLPGAHVDGGQFAAEALANGAWGVLATDEYAIRAAAGGPGDGGVVLTSGEPLRALQRLATAWRRELGAKVIGVTGSTGKTSTKDLLKAVIAPQRAVQASRANFNTEIGLPLEILAAPPGTDVLVLEMGMRGPGQIAELARIAEPDVAVIVSIGPVHLELLGSIAAIASAKAELIAALKPGGTAVTPAGEELLAAHIRPDVDNVTFGEGGDVQLIRADAQAVEIDARGQRLTLRIELPQAHLRRNLLAAVAAAQAIGVSPSGAIELQLSPGRGQRLALADDVTVIDDSYNANPMSMRAAVDDLVATHASRAGGGRPVAVLGDMLELGPDERRFHAELGTYAGAAGVELLITAGPLAAAAAEGFDGESHPVADAGEAAALAGELIAPGDTVLVKGSRGVGLELVVSAIAGGSGA